MSSISAILSTAARALTTHQKAMAVTAHNISNADTPGYSRQRAQLGAAQPLVTPYGVVGTGVHITGIERARDSLLDATWRRENSAASLHGERTSQLSRLERALGEPSENGLLATVEVFWNAWSDLSVDPLSSAARAVLHERGQEVTDRFGQISAGLSELRSAGSDRLDALVSRVNELATHIADLNVRITRSEAAGGVAGDLRDSRDRLLDELSGLVAIQVVERERGDLGVYVDGQALVDGSVSRSIERGTKDGATTIQFSGRSTPIAAPGGAIGGVLKVLDTELASAQTALNEFAARLIAEVNRLLEDGVNPAGEHGVPFFGGSSASTIFVSVEADAIAAGRGVFDNDTGTWTYVSGNNDIALDIQALRDRPVDGSVLSAGYADLVSRTGAKSASARTSAQVHDVLAHQANLRRESVSGVSIDEELAHLISQQAAYGAAARIVVRADEMLQTLLRMV